MSIDNPYTTLYPMLSHKQTRREITFKLIGPSSQGAMRLGEKR